MRKAVRQRECAATGGRAGTTWTAGRTGCPSCVLRLVANISMQPLEGRTDRAEMRGLGQGDSAVAGAVDVARDVQPDLWSIAARTRLADKDLVVAHRVSHVSRIDGAALGSGTRATAPYRRRAPRDGDR